MWRVIIGYALKEHTKEKKYLTNRNSLNLPTFLYYFMQGHLRSIILFSKRGSCLKFFFSLEKNSFLETLFYVDILIELIIFLFKF